MHTAHSNSDHRRKRSLVFHEMGSLIVLRENARTPTDEDWDDFLSLLARLRPHFERVRILVVTDGGGPSADQRKRLDLALGKKPVRVAVATDSIKVRFIVSSIALLNPQIASFSLREMEQAFDHLGLTALERKEADAAVSDLSSRISPDVGLSVRPA